MSTSSHTRSLWSMSVAIGVLACSPGDGGPTTGVDSGSGPRKDAGTGDEQVYGTPYTWDLPEDFPLPVIPEDNPLTVEKVALGRYLFYDTKLSGNGTQACGSCHLQELGFADGQRNPLGSTGDVVPRNSPGLANVAYASTLTWLNPSLPTLESQIPVPMFGEFPVELGISNHEQEVLDRLRDEKRYQRMFAAAFDDADPFSFENIVFALASFCRTLISTNSPYDRYVIGRDDQALSESAKRGLSAFFQEELECHHCHNTFNLTNAVRSERTRFDELAYFNTGLYDVDGKGAYPPGSEGLYEFTGDRSDYGKFRTPSLRNVMLTAPYTHDGSVETIEEMILIYAAGGRNVEEGEFAGDGRKNPNKDGFVNGFELSGEELEDILAFLEALTDEHFITDERFSDPFN